MDLIPSWVLRFVPPFIALAFLHFVKTVVRFHYLAIPDRKRWKPGIAIKERALPDHIVDWLRNFDSPRVHKARVPAPKNSSLQTTERYVIRDELTVLVRASSNKTMVILTVGLIDLSTGILQTRVGLVAMIYQIAATVFRLLVFPFLVGMVFTLLAFANIDLLKGVSPLWLAYPLAIYPLIKSIFFVQSESDRIESFLIAESTNSNVWEAH